MLKRLFIVGITLAVILANCSRDKSPTQPDSSGFSAVTIITDFEKFDRSAVEKDPFHIDSVYVSGDLLHIGVSYGGGCEKHIFDLYSTNGIYLSMPPQADVFLGHNGNGDSCEAYLSEKLVFDLTALIAQNPNGMGLRLHRYQETEPFTIIWWRTDQQ